MYPMIFLAWVECPPSIEGVQSNCHCKSWHSQCLDRRRCHLLYMAIQSQLVRKIRKQVFFTKLTMQNIEEFCFVSIVKRGHLLLPNFWPTFLKKNLKNPKIVKNNKNPKNTFFNIFASFLTFSASSQKNLNFQRSLERVRLLTRYILKSPIFLIRVDVDKKNPKK